MLRDRSFDVVDLDEIARIVVKPGKKAYKNIVKYFGKEILTESNEIDRPKLGKLVFEDANARKKLNSFTHFEILKELLKRVFWLWLKGGSLIILGISYSFSLRDNSKMLLYCTRLV